MWPHTWAYLDQHGRVKREVDDAEGTEKHNKGDDRDMNEETP